MFTKLKSTQFPPSTKPLMVYDGNCGFCKYWVIKWKKISGLEVDYKPYQEVATQFKDLKVDHFKEAVRLINTDGSINNGPDAAYITYYNKGKATFLHKWYQEKKWFRGLSDLVYQWVADNRSFMSKVSIKLFGKNPANPKPYWKYYLLLLIAVFTLLISLAYL